jgi:hypothetical protein
MFGFFKLLEEAAEARRSRRNDMARLIVKCLLDSSDVPGAQLFNDQGVLRVYAKGNREYLVTVKEVKRG